MLYFDRIGVSEGVDFNKTSASNECGICRYWYFLNCSFEFHSLLMMSMNLSDIAILNIKDSAYPCIISLISKYRTV